MAYKTNYLEKMFKGKIYKTIEEAVNAAAVSYATKDYLDLPKEQIERLDQVAKKKVINDLYKHYRGVIINSTNKESKRNKLVAMIEFDNSPITIDTSF